MKEILKRALYSPVVVFELLSTTILANVLSISSSVFVILVLNRYISYGLDGTLITLTIGAVIAVILEYLFRRLRFRFAARATLRKSSNLSSAAFQKLIVADQRSMLSLAAPVKRKMLNDAESVDDFYSPANLCILLDAPFAFLFIAAIYIANTQMALIVAALCVVYFSFGIFWSFNHRTNPQEVDQVGSKRGKLVDSVIFNFDLLRLFGVGARVLDQWSAVQQSSSKIRLTQRDKENAVQSGVRILGALATITIITLGARLVVDGSMSIGVLIGINILAARATMPILAFTQLVERHAKHKRKRTSLNQFLGLPNMQVGDLELSEFSGVIAANDLEFNYLGSRVPAVRDLNLKISSGDILVVRGKNGSGKTTLAHLLCGVLTPNKGVILIDDINLRQVNQDWWRKQIVYMPQEPTFYEGSILENFLAHKPDVEVQEVRNSMRRVGLAELCEETDRGLKLSLVDGGKNLSVGIRRRLALARSLIYGGRLVILDEPTENLDGEGRSAIYTLLNEFSQQKKTIICFSLDPEIVKGASHVLDLDDSTGVKNILLGET